MPSWYYNKQWGNAIAGDSVIVWGALLNNNINDYRVVLKTNGVALPGAFGTADPNPVSGSKYYAYNHYVGYKCQFSIPGCYKIVMEVRNKATNVKIDSSISFIRVFDVTDPNVDAIRVNMMIEKGLLFLFKNAINITDTTVSWHSNNPPPAFLNCIGVGLGLDVTTATALSVLALEYQNHLFSNNLKTDPYSEIVKNGLAYISNITNFSYISNHTDGVHGMCVSDVIGDGIGFNFFGGNNITNSFCLLSVIMANLDSTHAKVNNILGYSYWDYIYHSLDRIYWQMGVKLDASHNYIGAWSCSLDYGKSTAYEPNYEQWPVFAMIMSKRRLHLDPTANPLMTPKGWIQYGINRAYDTLTYYPNGGCGNSAPAYCSLNTIDIANTGGMLGAYSYTDRTISGGNVNAKNALSYIKNNYNNWYTSASCNNGWAGSLYAMFAMKRGLSSQHGDSLTIYKGLDFYKDMAWWLSGGKIYNPGPAIINPVKTITNCYGQKSDGSWTDSDKLSDDIYATSFAILILSPETFQPVKNYYVKDTTICKGQGILLPPLPQGGNLYEWLPDTWLSPSNTIYNPSAKPDSSTLYTGYEFDANKCPLADIVSKVYVSDCSGINSLTSLNTNVKLIPNPSNGIFNLVINNQANEKITLEINDINGRTVYTEDIPSSFHYSENIDLSQLHKGVYFVQVKSDSFKKVEKLLLL
jgi:hypothetical protein